MRAQRARKRRGFTLVEMLVVITLVGILAAAARPLVEVSQRRARETELRQALRGIRQAIDDYKRAADQGRIEQPPGASGYPPNLLALVDGVADQRASAASGRLYFLRRLPRDPFAPAELPAEQSWALRSHDSPPEAPSPGLDVFDVASRSTQRALDGSDYAQW